MHAKYESPTSNGSKFMTKVKVFRDVGQRSLVQNLYEQKGLIKSNANVNYESPSCNGSKVMGKVKVFRNVDQMSQGH